MVEVAMCDALAARLLPIGALVLLDAGLIYFGLLEDLYHVTDR